MPQIIMLIKGKKCSVLSFRQINTKQAVRSEKIAMHSLCPYNSELMFELATLPLNSMFAAFFDERLAGKVRFYPRHERFSDKKITRKTE